ncbi:MAG: NAD(P)-binding domain-containing protein, partial [Candidatus Thorarchaeota archaeon]
MFNTRNELGQAIVCVIGLGYVGLPLAQSFAKNMEVVGYDTNGSWARELKQSNRINNFTPTSDPKQISKADFIIICVPTPVTKSKEPDLSYIRSAAETVSQHLKKGSVVVLESTVYP